MSNPLSNFKFKKGILCVDGQSLEKIAKAHGTPLYVYSESGFLDPLRKLQSGLKGVSGLVCFAAKANSNLSILKKIGAHGGGLDIVSGGELFRAEQAGLPGSRIVFSGVGKTTSEINQALSYDSGKGIFSFNVESIAELYEISRLALKKGVRARIALRFNPDVNAKTHPYISTGLKKNKFGLRKKEVLEALALFKNSPSITFAGLSIHIGSQLLSLAPLREAYLKLLDLVPEAEKIMGSKLEFLDLGGGVGVSYTLGKEGPSLSAYTGLISSLFSKSGKKVVIEPGRTLAANAGVLLTEVLFRKAHSPQDFLIADAGMNDLLRPALYGANHQVVAVTQTRGKLSKFSVVGPVCETSDEFARNCPLPSTTNQGSLLAILSAGAYGFSMASSYNSRPRPAEVWVSKSGAKVIRKRESYKDLIKGEL